MTEDPPCLASARELVDPALRKAVARLDPQNQRVAGYHLGWIDADGAPAGHGGKLLRPALALLSARVAGADPSRAVTAAAAVELVHNFSLLHDDLMDGDPERRHRPTAWTVFGRSAALLAGDALLALATEMLLDDTAPGAVPATRALQSATGQLIAGQAADLDFEHRMDVSLDECIRMVEGKTGALLACAASIGARAVGAAGAGDGVVAGLWAFGAELGVAFQMVDDLLGLSGDPAVTGKPVGSDLQARKQTVPVVHALTSGGSAARRLHALYTRDGPRDEPLSEDAVTEAAELVAAAGSVDWTRTECRRRLDRAREHLHAAAPPSGARDELDGLAEFIVGRQR